MKKPTKGIAVDASTTGGNPGYTEYRGIDISTGEIVFHDDMGCSTNNLGEWAAIITALEYLRKKGLKEVVYSDSLNAINWVRKGAVKTNMHIDYPEKFTIELEEIIADKLKSLIQFHPEPNVAFWDNKNWGENPADFGRK